MSMATKVLLMLLGLLVLPVSLSAQTVAVEDLRKQAALLEQRHDWLEACRTYDEILRKDKTRGDVRQAYQRCLRRYHIVHRHRDRIYRQALRARVGGPGPGDVRTGARHDRPRLRRSGQDQRDRAVPTRRGGNAPGPGGERFPRRILPRHPAQTVEAFKVKLDEWSTRTIASRSDARAQVMAVGRTAQQMGFGPRPLLLTVIALEFFSGACNALDEYTFFLTPGQFREVQATLRGRLVAIGVDLALVEDRLEIVRVYPRSPAWEAGLARHDRILRIDGQGVEALPAEVAAERLRGKSGTPVKLQVLPAGQMMPRDIELTRRPVFVPSVEHELLRQPLFLDLGDGMTTALPVGKLTIACFQETTLQEVKEALASLQTDGMKVLILDLRGNPGGLFKSAVQVAELFLPDGIIVISQSHVLSKDKRLSGVIKVESMNPLLMPMVVLIDGDTASAAEVLAGALKDNGRAKLIGQTTFGKGTIQCIIPLEKPPFDKMPGGIRITVAKLLSPSWQPYSGQGIQPDIRSPNADGDAVLVEAQQVLLEMLKTMQPMTVPH